MRTTHPRGPRSTGEPSTRAGEQAPLRDNPRRRREPDNEREDDDPRRDDDSGGEAAGS